MNTYFRILSYARPLGGFLPGYILFTLIAVIFNAVNLALLIPLLQILFDEITPDFVQQYSSYPEFNLTLEYFQHLFNYYLLDIIQASGKLQALYYVCGVIIASVLVANLFSYLAAIILAKIRANVIKKIRISIFNNVTGLDIGFFTNERKGDIISRITNDVQEIELSVVNSMRVIFREPLQILAYLGAMLFLSTHLTLFALLYMLVTGFLISEITKRLKKKAQQSQESLARIVGILDETLSGMRIIKAFNAVKLINEKFKQEVMKYARINVSMAYKNELASPLSQFLGVTVVTGIVVYGGVRVLNGFLDASEFIAFIGIFSQILNPSKAISKEVSSIQRGLASAERIFRIVDLEPQIKDAPQAKKLESFDQAIEFRNVSFAYEKEPVLRNINLSIPKGYTVALVGTSGGGKSTLADLIPRFYDPGQGELLIDGRPIKDYQIESIRRQMGIVTQESILFNDTILNNIAFGKPEANREEVIQAAKIANAHQFIMQTEYGYDTNIGERGTKLSGGQRQRISIARAVLKNPPILILDEATSALDSESEKLVQVALTNLMKNRTSVVIAHRLSTIQHADEILVIQNGEIIERGRHEELLENNKVYTKLSSMQSVN
ncbi:MAG: ABC transporter ATP-binding protein [Candidatus Cyclobacteriaceae bacterium M3_2C_046]